LQSPRALPDWARLYHQTVSALDEAVGTRPRALEETGQRENTLVVFTSDPGLAIGQHGVFDKHPPYETRGGRGGTWVNSRQEIHRIRQVGKLVVDPSGRHIPFTPPGRLVTCISSTSGTILRTVI
jgi:arylsulfatase A-like enzyme